MNIDLHVHTTFSHDGFIRIKDAIPRAKQVGLDCIAITDHDNIAGHKLAKEMSKRYDFPVILGSEVKTIDGDILALDITEMIRPKMTIEETIDAVHDQGGIAVAAHPFSYLLYHKGVGKNITKYKFDAVEAFNARTFIGNGITHRLAVKHKIPMVADSDSHTLLEIGNAYTSVRADNIRDALKEIKKGRTKTYGRNISFGSIIEWYLARFRRKFFTF